MMIAFLISLVAAYLLPATRRRRHVVTGSTPQQRAIASGGGNKLRVTAVPVPDGREPW
jgi:hypothetical protein